jgi:flagellar L-ring protein precursor FlgH
MNRPLRHIFLVCAAWVLLGGCAQNSSLLTPAPELNPVGSGLVQPMVMRMPSGLQAASMQSHVNAFNGSKADLFRDRRAKHIGDVVTVSISIDDQASLNSNISRSRDSNIGSGLDIALDWLGLTHSGSAGLDASTDSSSSGKGSISRSERIQLSVAALVTQKLSNGYLVIAGTQEVRINNEVRELTVAGIVDPVHVTADNTIPYDKIAEARISYGGRGRVSDVQQPGFGQQLFDKYAPF